jgi:hypothetical protein
MRAPDQITTTCSAGSFMRRIICESAFTFNFFPVSTT